MKIETFPDKLHSDSRELQRILKEHIRRETGRDVQGDVQFTSRGADTSFWCTLQPAPTKGE